MLVWLLNKFLFNPICGLLAERRGSIQETYDKIEFDKQSMLQMKTDYEQRLAGIEAQARERIQNAIKEAEGMKNQILDEARAQAEQLRAANQQQLARDRQMIMIELRTQVADLALRASERLIGANLDDEKNRKLVQEFIDQVEVTA